MDVSLNPAIPDRPRFFGQKADWRKRGLQDAWGPHILHGNIDNTAFAAGPTAHFFTLIEARKQNGNFCKLLFDFWARRVKVLL
jgi:hypothetical protein